MPASKPWHDVIPEADRVSFHAAHLDEDRPIGAGRRPALLVVDMTLDFVDSRYPLGFSETGGPAIAANRRVLDAARAAGLPIYFTDMFAGEDYRPSVAERGRWKHRDLTPAPRPGDVIAEDLAPRPDETVIHKGWKPSAFFGTQLASLLIADRVDTLIVTGMTTSGCVRASVIDAFQHNLDIVIPHEACADRSQISHKVTLFDLHMKYADVVSVDEVIAYVEEVSGSSPGGGPPGDSRIREKVS
jgi:nicotinamidase-related amidase